MVDLTRLPPLWTVQLFERFSRAGQYFCFFFEIIIRRVRVVLSIIMFVERASKTLHCRFM